MADQSKFPLKISAINPNEQIKKLQTLGDRISDWVTNVAGSSVFLTLNVVWFISWILINVGVFGDEKIFDEYPFGFLTMVVSLEAIILSVFVLISQNRQSRHSEIRSELDYLTDLQADAENKTMVQILERIANKQNIDIKDLLADLETTQRKIVREHPLTKESLDD